MCWEAREGRIRVERGSYQDISSKMIKKQVCVSYLLQCNQSPATTDPNPQAQSEWVGNPGTGQRGLPTRGRPQGVAWGRAGEGATSLVALLPGLKALVAVGFLPHGPLYGVIELGAAGFPQREGSDPREREEERVSTTGIFLSPNPRGSLLTTVARLSVLGSITSPHPHSREGMGAHRQGSLGTISEVAHCRVWISPGLQGDRTNRMCLYRQRERGIL